MIAKDDGEKATDDHHHPGFIIVQKKNGSSFLLNDRKKDSHNLSGLIEDGPTLGRIHRAREMDVLDHDSSTVVDAEALVRDDRDGEVLDTLHSSQRDAGEDHPHSVACVDQRKLCFCQQSTSIAANVCRIVHFLNQFVAAAGGGARKLRCFRNLLQQRLLVPLLNSMVLNGTKTLPILQNVPA